MSRRTWTLIGLAVLIGAVAVVWALSRGGDAIEVDTGAARRQATFRSTVTASGEIVATRYADIGSSVMGKVVRLPVREGDRVRAGQVLAQIDAVQAQSGVTSADAQVAALEAEERALSDQVRAATSELAAAESRAKEADQQRERLERLFKQGLIAASDFETATSTADTARAQVATAKAAIDRAKRSQDAASRRIAQARAQQTSARDTLSKTSVVSPIDGTVSRLRVREGEMVVIGLQNQPGTTLMTVSDLSQIDAEVKVAEADVLRLALGQPATVTLEAIPGKPFTGKVVEIGASALPVTAGASAREFKVVVRLDNADVSLRPGLTCDAEIVTSERANVLTVPLQSVVIRAAAGGGDRTGVFVVRDGRAVFVPVTSGVIGGLDIEVSGVPENEPVIIGPYQVLRELADGAAVKTISKQN